MITLKKDRNLVYIKNWSDLEEMAGFRREINPEETKLKEIIGQYSGEHGKVICGLKNCHTQHQNGYIVVSTDGHITNIGKDCGEKYFGVDFKTMSSKLTQDIKDYTNREELHTFNLNNLNEWCETRLKIAKNINRYISQLRDGKGIPETIRKKISKMSRDRTYQIKIERELTEKEKAVYENTGRTGIKYIEENVATVSGIEAMYDQNNLKLLITDTLKKFIDNFPIDKIDLLSSKDLAYWAKEVKEIPNLKNKIDAAIEFCFNFLTFENLLPFEKIIEKQEEVAEWHNFLNSLKTLPSVKLD